MTSTLRMTVAEYLALPEEKPYREYAYGEVLTKAMPNPDHGMLIDEFAAAIREMRRELGGSSGPEIRVRFNTERGQEFRLPDYAYYRPGKPFREGDLGLPPTLAIEVRSPDESMAEQRAKCRYYRQYGVDVAWLVDPRTRTVEVFEGDADGAVLGGTDVLTSAFLPGFRLRLRDLFAVLES